MVIGESISLGDRSRLWHHKEAISVLKQDKGTSAVTAIMGGHYEAVFGNVGFCFINSQSSEERKLQRIPISEQHLLRPHLQKFYEDIIYEGNGFEYITPHTKIPSWFDRQSEGSFITIPLPPNYFDGELELMGFALCFVYEAQEHENMESAASNISAQEVKYSCNYSCRLSAHGGPDDDCPLLVCKLMDHDYVGSFRHWVYIAGGLFAERLNNRSVRAQVIIDRPGVKVKACGARLIYSGGVTEFVWNLNLRDEIPSHMRNLSSPNGESNEQEQETTSDHQLELKHVPVQYQAQMNRMIALYDTRGKNKQFLDHDAGLSSRTGSSTQVPYQRLERPESVDQSNELEQGTNSQLTYVAEGGCASDTRLLIEIEPHTSRDDSTSTKIIRDQLVTNVESFLEELFELGGKARSHDTGEGIGSGVGLPLPPELYNNKEWVGLALYVSFTLPPGVEVEMFGIRLVYEQDLKGLIQTITQCTIRSPLAVYNGHANSSILPDVKTSLIEASLNDNLIEAAKSSERRRSTLQEPIRDSKFISGQQIYLLIHAKTPFIPLENKDSVVEWKRNLELLLKCFFSLSDLSIDLLLNSSRTSFSRGFTGYFIQKEIPDWFPQHPSESMVLELPPNLENDVNFMGLVVCAAFSVHASEADVLKYVDSGHHAQLKFHFQFSSSDGSYGSIRDPMIHISPNNEFMWLYRRGFIWQQYVPRDILKDVLHKDTSVKVSCRTDSISSQVLGVQKCSFRILYKQDVEKFKQTIIQCFTSLFDNEDINRAYLVEEHPGYNYGTGDERESCEGETSGKSNDPDLIPFFIEIEPPASSTKITGQLRRNIESSLEQLFQGDNARDYDYGFILSPRVGAVMPWFSHQSFVKVVLLTAPLDLYKDKKWVGFALYVAFTQSPDPVFFCQCSLFGFPGNTVLSKIRWCPDQFSGSQRRLCFIHIPRASLPKHNDSTIFAAFDFSPPASAVVEMCGIRVVYDEDVKGLIQTITQSTIRNPPVYFSRDDKTHITSSGLPYLRIEMATSLVALSKACIQPTPAGGPGLVPSQKFGKVELQMHTRFHQKVTIEWKRNLELLLQSFFRLNPSIKLHLGGATASYEDPFADSYLFPQKEIPDWFTEKSLTSTFVTPFPDDLESDNNWMGFVLCAAFSVHPHPTDVGNYNNSQLTADVSCKFQWSSNSSQSFSFRGYLVRVMPNTKFMWLSLRGFIWLQFISRHHFKLDAMNKSQRQLEASFESGSLALAVQKCSLRILYKQDVQEYKQTLIQCFASVFDNLDHSQPYKEDDDSRHNKEPIHEDDQIDSFGTTSLSEDTQHETKTTVPVPQSETSGNSFNRFNSILFEPILYDNRSAVIFADFRGWEE
ncbi:hypothetical protein M0R45_034600 [Rubus argutus]|uniref:C-JID domain-containing protein n=1 Tax=Rubus argutus TaxID=59490 RepID=A0AAW1VUA3_RUBAR